MEPGKENKEISLSKEKEPLFITLKAKAEDSLSADSGTVVRANQFDEWLISLFLVVDWFYSG